MLVTSLQRRQRFDEIGLTHTCCLASKNSHIQERGSLYQLVYDMEFFPDENTVANHEHDEEKQELREEQQELVDELETYCQNRMGGEDLEVEVNESILVATLARRIVFIERGSALVASQARSQSTHKPCRRSKMVGRLHKSPPDYVQVNLIMNLRRTPTPLKLFR